MTLLRCAIALTVLLGSSWSAIPDQAPSGLSGEKVVVRLSVWSTPPDEATTEGSSRAGALLNEGDTGALYYYESRNGSGVGTGTAKAQVLAEAERAWWVDARVLEASVERVRLEFTWERHVRGAGGVMRVDKTETKSVLLREDERHVIDFVPTSSQFGGASLLFMVETEIQENPEFENAILRYEVWLHDECAPRSSQTQRAILSARQGDKMEFTIGGWRQPVTQLKDDQGHPFSVVTEYSGTIRGRLRTDGSIDAFLGVGRWMDTVETGEPRAGGIGDGGSKRVNLQPGETVKIVLPKTSGGSGECTERKGFVYSAPGMKPDWPFSVENNCLTVDFGALCAGKEAAVYVRVDRQEM